MGMGLTYCIPKTELCHENSIDVASPEKIQTEKTEPLKYNHYAYKSGPVREYDVIEHMPSMF